MCCWRIFGRTTFAEVSPSSIRRARFAKRKNCWAEELSLDVISQRRLEAELRRAGYRITQARISQMEYTVRRLLPVIPIALESGLGRPHVERIRRLERAAYTIWRDRCYEPADDFDEVFTTLCRRYDSLDWDTDVLRSALESEIAAALDVNIHTVRVMLDAELGRPGTGDPGDRRGSRGNT